MSNLERGPYEPPSDDPRIFDAAETEEEEDEGSRLPLLIVIALLVLAAFGGVVWLAYSQGVARGHADTTTVASSQTGSGEPATDQAVKPYEQPAPSDEDVDNAASVTPDAAQETGPTEAPSSPVIAKPAPQRLAAAPTPAAQTPASEAPAPATSAPQETPAAAPTPPPAAKKPPAKPVQVASAPAAAAPPAAEKPAAGDGGIALQIGAYKSEAEASSAWSAYKAKHSATVGSYGPQTVRVDLGAKGIWYRLRIGPFASRNDATALCDKLKAEGGVCFLAK